MRAASSRIVDQLDLGLALRRVKHDQALDRGFFNHPFERRLIEVDEVAYISDLLDDLRADRFIIGPQINCEVPKAGGHVRPGGWLSMRDQIYYTALVGACLNAILVGTNKSRRLDFSYRLNLKTTSTEWLLNPFAGWSRFRTASLAEITSEIGFVVQADVAGYYETIAHRELLSDLRQYGASNALTTALSQCLSRWASVRGRGIPQGYSASDLLGKLYLSQVDDRFADAGFRHFRYVDDFRVFVRTLADSRLAIAALGRLLRERGLVFQSGKTAILSAELARSDIDGIPSIIEGVRALYYKEIATATGLATAYMSLPEADAQVARAGDAPVEIIERAYQEEIEAKDGFDKSVFHFLINRLGGAGSRRIVPHTIHLLVVRPEETKAIIKYWRKVGIANELDNQLAAFLCSPDAVYAYQIHQLLEWRSEIEPIPTRELVAVARHHCFRGGAPLHLLATCRRFLAKWGTIGDIAGIREQYGVAGTILEKSEIMCCIARLEPGIRNEFLSAAGTEHDLTNRAARAVRQGSMT